MAKSKTLMNLVVLGLAVGVGVLVGRATKKDVVAAQSYGLAQIPEQYEGAPALYGETASIPLHPRVSLM